MTSDTTAEVERPPDAGRHLWRPAEGLALTTGLTLVADKDNPLSALIAGTGGNKQSVSYFNVSGDIETKPWATPPASVGDESSR